MLEKRKKRREEVLQEKGNKRDMRKGRKFHKRKGDERKFHTIFSQGRHS